MRGADDSNSENPTPPPRANPYLVGHGAAERELLRLYRAGRLPHAMLFIGPRGIGKATLAFRLARFLLARSSTRQEPGGAVLVASEAEVGLAIDPASGVFRRVAAGGHADLLTVERAWDPRRRRLRGEIVVEDTREITAFFRLSAAEEGWRIVIIDGAEEMNRNAANALLKILEEPPDRGLLLLVSHNPGRLLSTIRSRCRRLVLAPLPTPLAAELLRRYRPQLDESEAAALSALSGGSAGRALELAEAGGLELYRSIIEMLAQAPAIDLGRLHALTDRLARADAEDAYRASEELLARFLARLAADIARGRAGDEEIVAGEGAAISRLAGAADAARWAELRSEIERNFATARNLNL
ncbi:MAG: DNA polymerase III subunit delta', partial [Alphaproteobacteria bacterium]|nr:DNA polymerase III subunit delta' [Alphaproteobacteria bacterium]